MFSSCIVLVHVRAQKARTANRRARKSKIFYHSIKSRSSGNGSGRGRGREKSGKQRGAGEFLLPLNFKWHFLLPFLFCVLDRLQNSAVLTLQQWYFRLMSVLAVISMKSMLSDGGFYCWNQCSHETSIGDFRLCLPLDWIWIFAFSPEACKYFLYIRFLSRDLLGSLKAFSDLT